MKGCATYNSANMLMQCEMTISFQETNYKTDKLTLSVTFQWNARLITHYKCVWVKI